MGHSDHYDGPGIDLECDSCGELDLEAAMIYCARCLETRAVCFNCIPKNDERRIDSEEWPRLCAMCQMELEDE